MLSYVIRRVLATVPVMAVVALFVFSLLYIAPGDPAAVIAGDQATPADVARIRASLGLDRPFLNRFPHHVVSDLTMSWRAPSAARAACTQHRRRAASLRRSPTSPCPGQS